MDKSSLTVPWEPRNEITLHDSISFHCEMFFIYVDSKKQAIFFVQRRVVFLCFSLNTFTNHIRYIQFSKSIIFCVTAVINLSANFFHRRNNDANLRFTALRYFFLQNFILDFIFIHHEFWFRQIQFLTNASTNLTVLSFSISSSKLIISIWFRLFDLM